MSEEHGQSGGERQLVDLVVIHADGTFDDRILLDGRDEIEAWTQEQEPPLGLLATVATPRDYVVWFMGEADSKLQMRTPDGVLEVKAGDQLVRAFSPSGWLEFMPCSPQSLDTGDQ